MHEPRQLRIPSADGVVVAVHDYGGPGIPTIFLHGTGMCGRMWEPILDRLPAERFRFLTVDLRGHGLTETPGATEFQDHRMIADLTAVIDALDIKEGYAVGHSMGGGTAILTSIERPAAFRAIWTFEPIVMAPGVKRVDQEWLEGIRRRRASFPSRQAVFDRYRTRPPLDELHPDCLRAYVAHGFVPDESQGSGAVRLCCEPEHEARAFEQFDRDGFSRLDRVTSAVFVASGGGEPDYPPAISAPLIVERLTGGRHECWFSSKHFGPFAELDRTATSIVSWFDGHGAATP